MAFTIPNQTDASHFHQAEVDSGDIDILVEGFNGDGVIGTGLAVTTASCALKVNISAGTAIINGARVVLASGTCTTHATADSCNPRFDLVTFTCGGAVARVAGTAAARPVFPAVPAGSAVLATVYIPAGDTAIAANQITDKRVNVENIAAAGTADDILMRLGTGGDVAIMHKSGALSADATLTNVVEGSPDHLGTAANSLIVSNITNDGDMMFVVSDGGVSKGLLKLCGANGRTVFHGGDILISGAQKLYFNDVGGEYISGDGCTLTITGATALTPTIGSTAWANATHAHGASCTGGTICANVLAGTTLKSTVVNSSLENVGTLTALQVDYINANASTVTITDSTDTGDLASLAVTTHGATTLTTTDDDAAAAHFTLDADGNITLDAATGIVTIEDGGTEVLRFTESCSGDVTIKLAVNCKDLIFTDHGDAEGFRILDAAAGVTSTNYVTGNSGTVKFLDGDGNKFFTLAAHACTTACIAYTFPACGGSCGNVLATNGSGVLSWASAGGARSVAGTTDNALVSFVNSGSTFAAEANLTFTGSALTLIGTATVGVDGTGHDVKFFGCAAGAFMHWDESANLLDIRGATAAGPGHLKLTTGELTVVANDVLGRIDFQAPLEADCSADARLVGASIAAVAQGTFGNAVNATDIIFYTGHSETAAEKFRFTSQGEIGIAGANYGSDGQVLTSTGCGTAVAWECAGGGGGSLVLIDTEQAAGACTACITLTGITNTYDNYLILVSDFRPITDGGHNVSFRIGCSGGIKSGATCYSYHIQSSCETSGNYQAGASAGDCEIALANLGVGGATAEGFGAALWMHIPSDAGLRPTFSGTVSYQNALTRSSGGILAGQFCGALCVTQVRLAFGSGNIYAGGRVSIYGVAHA
jgi:hypothetical protein